VFITIADTVHGKLNYMFTALVPAQDVPCVQAAPQALPTERSSVVTFADHMPGYFYWCG